MCFDCLEGVTVSLGVGVQTVRGEIFLIVISQPFVEDIKVGGGQLLANFLGGLRVPLSVVEQV